ncbi:MAG: hypothetical protein B7733_23575 [Myxococcales bacterium FL481]|nr:MAG: hypothetical protein B7733_23575 [Myxococcales bacterium FL481]
MSRGLSGPLTSAGCAERSGRHVGRDVGQAPARGRRSLALGHSTGLGRRGSPATALRPRARLDAARRGRLVARGGSVDARAGARARRAGPTAERRLAPARAGCVGPLRARRARGRRAIVCVRRRAARRTAVGRLARARASRPPAGRRSLRDGAARPRPVVRSRVCDRRGCAGRRPGRPIRPRPAGAAREPLRTPAVRSVVTRLVLPRGRPTATARSLGRHRRALGRGRRPLDLAGARRPG